MQEIELKLQIPPAARAAVDKALRGRGTPPAVTRLVAAYFDTPDRRLARAGMALRVRREGRAWVQTVKAGGPHALQRLEHNAPRRAPVGGHIEPDLSLHDGTPAAALLAAALAPTDGQPAAPLVELYRTDIRRTHRSRRTPLGTVELAWDEGHISAGGRKLAVSELEIELLRGDPRAVIEEARRWVHGHGLWLDTQTKAHRGDHLARQARPQPRVVAWPALVADGGGPTVAQAWERLHAGLLSGLLDNASALAGEQGTPEHVRRLRVGLRRLRSAWRLFDGWGPTLPQPVRDGVVALYRRLGLARDNDVLAALAPALARAGAPVDVLPPRPAAGAVVEGRAQPQGRAARAATAVGVDETVSAARPAIGPGADPGRGAEASPAQEPGAADLAAHLRSPAVHGLWLDLLTLGLPPAESVPGTASVPAPQRLSLTRTPPWQLSRSVPAAVGDATPPASDRPAAGPPTSSPAAAPSAEALLRPLALRRLKRWHQRAAQQAARYTELSDEERHDLRKRLKRVRDGLDALAALLPPKRLRRQLTALKAAQDALGRLNDEAVAAQIARQQAEAGHGPAWFIVGWLAGRHAATVQAAAQALADWRQAPTAWK
jgi:inorganic triphosphatase YgiF